MTKTKGRNRDTSAARPGRSQLTVMSQPLNSHATMFYSGTQTTAVLVETGDGGRQATEMTFASPELALAWCRRRLVAFVWLPPGVDPVRN